MGASIGHYIVNDIIGDTNAGCERTVICLELRAVTAWVLLNFLVTVKAAPRECVIRTGLP